jgi:hypothetical protein
VSMDEMDVTNNNNLDRISVLYGMLADASYYYVKRYGDFDPDTDLDTENNTDSCTDDDTDRSNYNRTDARTGTDFRSN